MKYTRYLKIIFVTPSNIITFYRTIKCDLLSSRRAQNGYHQDFQYLMVSVHFLHEVATLVFMLDKLQSREKKIFDFFDGTTKS